MNPPNTLLTPLGLALLVGALLSDTPARAADPLSTLFGDPVIATGKNVEVKRSQLDEAFISYRANLAARGDDIASARKSGCSSGSFSPKS